MNLIVSLLFSLLVFAVVARSPGGHFACFLLAIAVYRMLSRSIEIAVAFGTDVLEDPAKGSSRRAVNCCVTWCSEMPGEIKKDGAGIASANKTGLNKYERIRLAITSYAEVYVYSAAAYLAVPGASVVQAIKRSLDVGTLTNVGAAVNPLKSDHPISCCLEGLVVRLADGDVVSIVQGLAYIQVFTTLSLVVLSLAAYLSRE